MAGVCTFTMAAETRPLESLSTIARIWRLANALWPNYEWKRQHSYLREIGSCCGIGPNTALWAAESFWTRMAANGYFTARRGRDFFLRVRRSQTMREGSSLRN